MESVERSALEPRFFYLADSVLSQRPSKHLQLLRSVALYEEAGTSLARRRVALRSSPSNRADTERLIALAQRELYVLVPALLQPSSAAAATSPSAATERDCSNLLIAIGQLAKQGSHLVIHRHTIPQGLRTLAKSKNTSHLPVTASDSAVLVQAYLAVEDYFGLLHYVLTLLSCRAIPSTEVLAHIMDVLEGDLDTWTALNALPVLGEVLAEMQERLKLSGAATAGGNGGAAQLYCRLVNLLRALARAGHLEANRAAAIEQEYQDHVMVSRRRFWSACISADSHTMAVPLESSPANTWTAGWTARAAITHHRQLVTFNLATMHNPVVPLSLLR